MTVVYKETCFWNWNRCICTHKKCNSKVKYTEENKEENKTQNGERTRRKVELRYMALKRNIC
jgi:hypothetical protein